jgi:hypothetical protein
MKKFWLPYDLQFFADEGGEESDVAEQTEEETTEAEEDESEEEESDDRDSIYAAARRRAESEARQKYENEQRERDAYYARKCEGRVNPETGAPITTEAEYRAALDAQERMNMTNELQSKGIDPAIIDQYISNNPAIREAERLVEEARQTKAQEQISEDIKTIMSIDKSFEDEESLTSSEEFQKAVQYASTHTGVLISEAYKIVNFDNLRSANVKAAKQAAINEAKGKGHLTGSHNTPNGKAGAEIPASQLGKWERMFPGKTHKELNAIYAKVQSNH